MVILENEHLKVTLHAKGAELVSLVDKITGVEYIWDGEESVWPFHAPNLFPIVGTLVDNTLHVDGTEYTIQRHGFARHSTFRRIESSPEHAQFALRYDEETLKVYPFKFEFQVVFHLSGRSLKIMYKVINLDDKKVYFSIGAHPGFNVPLAANEVYEDYFLEFEHDENLHAHTLTEGGLFDGNTTLILNGNQLPLQKNLFDNDALVFKKLNSRKVTLRNKANTRKVQLDFPHFNSLAIWAKPGEPFLCIEPWLGYADTDAKPSDIKQKEAIQYVEHGHVFEIDYTITV